MRATATLRIVCAAALGLAPALGCLASDPAASSPAADAAQSLFEVARLPDPEARRLPERFDPAPTGASAAALHDVLDELARVRDPRVVGVEPIDGAERMAVDIVGTPAGGGTASYSIHVVLREGSWRVEWIGGPDLSWPTRASGGRGPGLTSSPSDGTP